MIAGDALRLLAALRLASPALPIGGFSYSQGLETAIERGWVRDEADARRWLHDLLRHVIARWEAPIVLATCEAVARDDAAAASALDARWVASRETAELRAETLAEYLDANLPHFGRVVGFRPSGWNYRPSLANNNMTGWTVGQFYGLVGSKIGPAATQTVRA